MSDPVQTPIPTPEEFDLESALHRAAHSILALRHRDIPAQLLDDQIEHDPALRLEYDGILETLHVQMKPQPRRTVTTVSPWFINFGQPGGNR